MGLVEPTANYGTHILYNVGLHEWVLLNPILTLIPLIKEWRPAMLKQLRHKRKVKRNLRLVKRYYGVSVSKHPKRAYQR